MIQISAFSMVILVVVIHTILVHLLNWMYRLNLPSKTSPSEGVFGVLILSLCEILGVIFLIQYYMD